MKHIRGLYPSKKYAKKNGYESIIVMLPSIHGVQVCQQYADF